jgi:Bifunctional DNA primase/polymerase, N-terminal
MNEDGEAAWERMDKAYVYRLALLAGGYVPIPLNGKRPANTAWQSDVAPDESEIASWKTTCGSAFNTGILTKWTPAIDIDVTDGGVANAIADRAAELIEEDAPMAVRFGKHPKRAILFRTDEPFDKIRTSDFASPDGATHHVEILCDGQQLAAFGRHPETGNEYEWPKGAPGSIRQSELPLLTKAMAKQLVDAAADIMRRAGWEEKKSKRRAENGAKGPTALAGEGGYRERQYAKAALDGCANQLANSTPGGRNDALNKAAFRLGTMIARGWIPRATVEQRLYEAAVQNGSVKDDGSIAALATIKSGIEAGLREPHADLQNRELTMNRAKLLQLPKLPDQPMVRLAHPMTSGRSWTKPPTTDRPAMW